MFNNCRSGVITSKSRAPTAAVIIAHVHVHMHLSIYTTHTRAYTMQYTCKEAAHDYVHHHQLIRLDTTLSRDISGANLVEAIWIVQINLFVIWNFEVSSICYLYMVSVHYEEQTCIGTLHHTYSTCRSWQRSCTVTLFWALHEDTEVAVTDADLRATHVANVPALCEWGGCKEFTQWSWRN